MLALCYDFTLSYLKGVVLKATNLKKRGISSLTGLSGVFLRSRCLHYDYTRLCVYINPKSEGYHITLPAA